jgi:hypothetical protein
MTPFKAAEFQAVAKVFLPTLLALLIALSAGCGGHSSSSSPDCSVAIALGIAPNTATADHLAAAPGNKISFVASDALPNGCIPIPGPLRLDLKW